MSQSCFNFSLNENKRIAEDFGEIETQKLIELYFPDKNPASYNEFISNDKVKEALGLKGITEANKLLNTNYKKEISNQQLINLKSIISQTNNKLKGENKNIVYKLYNVKQLGESDNYTWGIREIKGNLDVDAKIERALTRGKTEQAKNLKNLNDNNQLTLFQLSNKQIIKPGVQELFDSNPELANQVYEALGFKNQTPKRLTKSDRTLSKYISIGKSEFEKAQKEANTKSSDFNHNGFRWYESEDELFGGKDWRKDELPQSNSGTFEDDYYKLQVEFSQKARSFVIDKIKEFFKTKGWLESKELGTGFFDSGREEDVLEQLIGFNDIVEELNKKEYDEAVRKNASLSKLISWLEYNHPEDFDEMGFELLYDLPQDELFQAIRYWYKPLEGIEFTELADIYDPNSSYNKKHPEDIKSKDASDLRKFIEKEIGIKNKLYPSLNNQITPQQKQKALQLYSQYLDTIFPERTNIVYSTSTLDDGSNFLTDDINYSKKYKGITKPYIVNLKNSLKTNYGINIAISNILFEENPNIDVIYGKEGERISYKDIWAEIQQDPDLTQNEAIKLLSSRPTRNINVFVVKNKSEKYELNTKQDIENFKNFINKENKLNNFDLDIDENLTKKEKLTKFFTQFGFKFEEGDLSTDLLKKIIYVNKNDNELFINNSVKALSQLLLANTNIDFNKLKNLIENTEEFKSLLNNSTTEFKNNYYHINSGNKIPINDYRIYQKDYENIKKQVIEKYLKESLLDNKNLKPLHKLIIDFINWLKNLFETATNLKDITDSLIQQVFENQKEIIINSNLLKNKEKVNLNKALKETKHGKNIIKIFGDFGLILTGSISASEQGTIWRKIGKLLHDIDWIVPKDFNKDYLQKLFDEFPGATLIRQFDSPGYYTRTYVVPPKGYTIANLEYFEKEKYNEKYIKQYDLLDQNNKIVNNYRRYYDVTPEGKVYETKEVYNENLQNVDVNLDPVLVDFFENKQNLEFKPYTVNVEGVKLQLSNWLSSFSEKLRYGRAKDLLDYALFIPNDLNQSKDNKSFQLEPTIQKDPTEIIQQVDTLLNDYINNNNIKVEFKDRVLDDNGNDVVAFYNSVKKVIEINQNQRDSKTLPEELAHHLHLALGKDHILVKRAFNLLNRVDYKAMLGQEYVDLYKNNTDLLKFEILGKLTAAAVRGEKIPLQMNTVEGNKLWDTIKRMIDAVIKLFKPDVNVQKELDNLSNQFANMLKSGVKVDSEKSINAKLYQTNKDLINLSSKIKPAYVYYTTLSTALKKKQKQFSALSEEYKIIQNQINTIDISLRELIQNENELPLINLVEETITTVAQNINDFEINYSKGIMPSEKNIIEAVEILKKFSGFPGTESKINALKARLINFIKPYLANKASEVLGKPVTEEDISAVTSDINVLEKNFGTLARTEFTLSRMLGLLIKQKQNTIERENKQAFEQVQAATNKLKDWAASKGMSLEQAFDVLQQEYRGTRILTKEYTSEFYKLINDTYKLDPEKAKEARAKIAIWDAANKKWIPKSTKYNNPNYQLIHKKGNEDLLNYYNFFKDQIQKISDNTLPIELDDYFIPNVYEETLLDILKTEDAVGDKLKDSVIHILEFNPFEKMGTVDKQMDVIYDADLIGDKIPLKYIQALPEDKKSKNLSAALLKFMYFANSYNHMNEILPIANLVQETITDPDTSKILQYGNPNLNVAAKSNIVDMVKTIKEMQILGKMRKENEMFNVLGYKLNYGKLIDFGLQYTSKIRLGLNPFAALANVAVGNLGNIIEAAGGKYFTLSEYFSALGTFTTEAKKVDGLINLFNPLMEMDDYENLKKLGVGSKEYREKINGLLYAPTRMGEKQMQTTTMIAILKHKKVDIKDKKGNVTGSISMLDAFDSNGKWDTAKMGYELNEQEINKITNRVHGVNQMIHGRYSAKDAAAMQQYAMYRALMQFKKWIPAAVEQRFMARRYDPLLDEETEGRYWAYAKGLRLMMAKLKNDAKKIEENKFTELDWYNMRRNAMEVLMIGLMFGLTTFLKAGDDDDELKRNASYKTYMRLLNSVSGDLMQWYLPGTFLDKAMVLPVTKTLRSLERTIQYTPYMFGDYTSDASGTYEAGERKDENKFWSNFFNNVPFGSTTADMYRTWFKDDVSYIPRNR
jgi:hypothetical protein